MRHTRHPQLKLGELPISQIEIDLNSRDDIPPLLLGLQHIYCTVELRQKIFAILEKKILPTINKNNGRPGMDLWKILIFGVLRLNLNCDYDRLCELANNHITIRQMLGHGPFDFSYVYKLQTLKDNVGLLTPEMLNEINILTVKEGHRITIKEGDEALRGRCDTFVLETNIHFPTDINVLFDATRKIISLIASLSAACGITEWRQGKYNIQRLKRLYRKAQKLKRSTSKNDNKKQAREQLIKDAHMEYCDLANKFIVKAKCTLSNIEGGGLKTISTVMLVESFITHAERQIDQIIRRVVKGEVIPHEEKVFSIFEEHTEWINKGKAGVPVELGLRVCILEDQHGFILNHLVMEKETDDKVAVPIVKDTKKQFSDLQSTSFDKGFYSPANRKELQDHIDLVVLPKKGRLSAKDKEIEYSEEFVRNRHKHSAVESAINALEVHGLDTCPDHGIDGFKRYVALAVLARNIQQLGVKIKQQRIKQERRKQKLKKAA
ncbi:MAG: ISNCY family transposase [Desulfobulbaceae bacterium]|nr:ISNCY family transposase [Desulfobulbaceae bacterium]